MERIAKDVSMKFEMNPAIEDDIKYRELIECIKAHQDAIKYKNFVKNFCKLSIFCIQWHILVCQSRFAVLVESSYTKLFIFQLGMNMLLISISLLQVFEEMLKKIISRLFVICAAVDEARTIRGDVQTHSIHMRSDVSSVIQQLAGSTVNRSECQFSRFGVRIGNRRKGK